MKHLWTLWWMRRSLAYDRVLPFHTSYVNFPAGMDFWPIEPLNGLLAAVLWPVPLVATANLLALLNLALDGVFGALLGRELSGSRLGGLAAGLVLQTSAFALYTLEIGVGELQHLWLLPLGFWSMLRLIRQPRWRYTLLTGTVAGLATLSCLYHGFFLAVGLIVLGLAGFFRRQAHLSYLCRLVVAAALALAIAVPVLKSFSSSYGMDERPNVTLGTYVWGEGYGQPVTDPVAARLQPENLLASRIWVRESGSRELKAYGGGRLLGFPLLVLVALVVLRRPIPALPWLAVALTGILLAMGSYLSMGGELVTMDGRRLAMPFLFLNRALGYIGEPLNFPVRFLALSSVSLAAVAGMGMAIARGYWRWLVAALVVGNAADVQLRQLLPRPLTSFSLPDLTFLQSVADHGGHGLLDLSLAWRTDQESRFQVMAAQMVHQHPIQAVPLERVEFFARDGLQLMASLKLVEDLEDAWLRKPITTRRDYRSDLYVLREAGFREILVSYRGGKEPVPAALSVELEAWLGVPLAEDETTTLYAIPEIESTAAEREAWQAEYALRLDMARRSDATLGPELAGGSP